MQITAVLRGSYKVSNTCAQKAVCAQVQDSRPQKTCETSVVSHGALNVISVASRGVHQHILPAPIYISVYYY